MEALTQLPLPQCLADNADVLADQLPGRGYDGIARRVSELFGSFDGRIAAFDADSASNMSSMDMDAARP